MKKRAKRLAVEIAVALIALGAAAYGALMAYKTRQISRIPDLSFFDALRYTTNDRPEAVITVGVIEDGVASYTVYGENASERPRVPHVYELASLTKTFTAALVSRAIDDGLIELDATIDRYLALPDHDGYPTVEALLTHTAGYKPYYFETPMIANFFKGRNSYYGVTNEHVLKRAGARRPGRGAHDFVYSNFGYAVLGLVLASVYETDYPTLLNEWVRGDLGLEHTGLSDGTGNLGHYTAWRDDDAYLAAGGMTSTIDDMLAYAAMQLQGEPVFARTHGARRPIRSERSDYRTMGINMDAVGMAWITDEENHIVWHNGGLGHYNSYLGFDRATQTAVVVLSNLSPDDRIPATLLGIKRLNELRMR